MGTIYVYDITQDSVVDGLGIRTVVWLSGCNIHCQGCHNKKLQDINSGNEVDIEVLAEELNKETKITFSGGDPLYQLESLDKLLGLLKPTLDIWVYTGYDYDKVSEMLKTTKNFLKHVNYIKCGPFVESLLDTKSKFRGSSNQKIYKIEDNKIFDVSEIIDRTNY